MFPKRVDRFKRWAQDMVEGAQVDRPRLTGSKISKTRRKAKPKRRRRRNAKKE